MKLLPCPSALTHEDSLAHPTEGGDARAQFGEVTGRCHPALVGDGITQGQALKVGLVPQAATVERHAVEVRRRRAIHVVNRDAGLHRRAVVPHWPHVAKGEVLRFRIRALENTGRAGSVGDDVASQQAGEQGLARLDAGEHGEHPRLGVGGDAQGLRDPRRALRSERPGHRRVWDGEHVLLEPLDHVAGVGRPQHVTAYAEKVGLIHKALPPSADDTARRITPTTSSACA